MAAASNLLQAHHSAQRRHQPIPMPNGTPGSKGPRGGQASSNKGGGKGGGGGSAPLDSDWACHICNYQDNRDWRKKCRRCDAYRNDEMGRRLGLGRGAPTLAERQVQQQRSVGHQQQNQQRKKEEAERKELKKEVERLRELVSSRSCQQPAAVGVDGEEGGDDLDEGSPYASWTEDERAKRLELAKGGLAYVLECNGENSEQAVKCREEIAALQRASREAKPFKAHRAQLERRRERLRAQQERDEEAITAAQAEIQQLQEKVDGLRAAVTERAKAITEVSEELTEIVQKALAEETEGGAPKPPWTQETSPWGAMSAAISGLAAQPGIPAEFAALLVHVQQVAATLAAKPPAAPAQPCPPPSSSTPPGPSTQQQQQQQQHQQQQQAASSATPPPGKTGLSAPAVPTALAPHARTTNTTHNDVTRPVAPSNPPSSTDDGRDKGTFSTSDACDGTDARPASAGAAAAASPASGGTSGDNDPELVEDDAGDDSAMAVDIEASLAMLPEANRRKLRAAIRIGGAKAREHRDGDDEGSRRGERERSPRPNRNNEDKEL